MSICRKRGHSHPAKAHPSIEKTLHNNDPNRIALIFTCPDYTLNNPDTLTKYKDAAAISQKVLAAVSALCVAGEKIVTICEKGDALLEEEIAKVYRGKKIAKGK